jgi:hypothetical protein
LTEGQKPKGEESTPEIDKKGQTNERGKVKGRKDAADTIGEEAGGKL